MEEGETVNPEKCPSRYRGQGCMLHPSHAEFMEHARIEEEGLLRWSDAAADQEAKAEGGPLYWNGYLWEDVLRVKAASGWFGQEWRPGEEPHLIEYRHPDGKGGWSSWNGWGAEPQLRAGGLRKEDELDYVR